MDKADARADRSETDLKDMRIEMENMKRDIEGARMDEAAPDARRKI